MATVYLWKPTKSSVGHISMELADKTYISHWPESKKKNMKGLKSTWSKPTQSLKEDIEVEKRNPDKYISFSGEFFDSSKISMWWEDLKSSARYNLFTSNCAHIVCEALKRMNFKNSEKIFEFERAEFAIKNPRLKIPNNVFKMANDIILETKKVYKVSCLCDDWWQNKPTKKPSLKEIYLNMFKTLDNIGGMFDFSARLK